MTNIEKVEITKHDYDDYIKFLKTGISPERVAELVEAERDGRLVVLPIKLGNYLYWIEEKTIFDAKVVRIEIEHEEETVFTDELGYEFTAEGFIECIGKTVFLTREEAEKALVEKEWAK